jgi:hypothetical protein
MNKVILLTVNGFLHRAIAGTMVVCALVVTSFSHTVSAQQLTTVKNTPEIKYIGTVQNKLVFQVDLQGTPDNAMFVSIKDDEGYVLFTEKIKNNKFSRKFAFDKEEFEGKKLSFVIYDTSATTAQTFEVSRNLRFVEDVVITRL